jgi:putative ABC transport system permease protein
MKFFPLLIANLFRKKIRTALTLGSFSVALFLFCLLATIDASFNQGVEVAGVDRLVVLNRTSLIQPLPYSYQERLLQINGVKAVTFATWFGGIYQNERNFFPQFAIDYTTYPQMYPEFTIPPEQWEDFIRDREGCVVGRGTFVKYGWKLGDRIPLRGTIFPGAWEFNIRAVYEGTRNEDDTTQFWFRYDYLDERRDLGKGTVGWYMVKVDTPDYAAQVAAAVDRLFSNSPFETKTETEKSFASDFIKQVGNIKLIMISIGGVVFFTLLLVTGSTMSMSVRERTGEIAVLKTIGFSDIMVLCLVLGESLLLALVGGGTGLVLAKLFTLGGDPTGGFLPVFYLAPRKMAMGLVLALIIGILCGILPALFAMRLKIVEALRGV